MGGAHGRAYAIDND
nr:hypothetical protein [Tanacetum cinerariifolium]